MGILLFLRKKYLSTTIIYGKKKEIVEEGGKHSFLYTEPELEVSYPWCGNESRVIFATVLVVIGILSTFVFIIIIV
jgi:hypothetical protein